MTRRVNSIIILLEVRRPKGTILITENIFKTQQILRGFINHKVVKKNLLIHERLATFPKRMG